MHAYIYTSPQPQNPHSFTSYRHPHIPTTHIPGRRRGCPPRTGTAAPRSACSSFLPVGPIGVYMWGGYWVSSNRGQGRELDIGIVIGLGPSFSRAVCGGAAAASQPRPHQSRRLHTARHHCHTTRPLLLYLLLRRSPMLTAVCSCRRPFAAVLPLLLARLQPPNRRTASIRSLPFDRLSPRLLLLVVVLLRAPSLHHAHAAQ